MSTTRGLDCRIHPTAVVGDDVDLGDRVVVGPYAVLLGPLVIGDDCWIGPHATIGTPPEIFGWEHPAVSDPSSGGFGVEIGPGSIIREMCVVHRGSERTTVVGARSFVMNRVSVEHDVQLGEFCVVAAGSTFAGHVTVGAGCNFGMGSVVHQRRLIGPGAMVGMGGVVTKDIPPFATVVGNPVRLHRANSIGMARQGYAERDIAGVIDAYAAGRVPDADMFSASVASAFDEWATAAAKPLLAPPERRSPS